ncbi:hypothetical protein PFBG_06073 [Plasmodium falciparum 7G8]|uniref:Rifin n=1 Tax=Plasmodium falciparum (isolate 7G8) TaxID=57266 RepID=W7F5Q5_PLAF8|nr:hypothetical protein PFBG_06073 [Plasmodium falciparum 7G8]
MNHYNRAHMKNIEPTKSYRSLCECELYAPTNYDNDPEMKAVMQDFDRQTSQRFEEYNEHMKDKRKKCKAKCDKDIQKIILKDKLEKELMDKFATLQTDIQNDAIPTCVCENALNQLKPAVFKAAITAALKAGASNISAAGIEAGDAAGMKVVIHGLQHFRVDKLFHEIFDSFVKTSRYTEVTNIARTINSKYSTTCLSLNNNFTAPPACTDFQYKFGIFTKGSSARGTPAAQAIPNGLRGILGEAEKTADAAAKIAREGATAAIKAQETALIEAGFNSSITSINASIFAIVVVVLIMVIIYLILRYRRKKKIYIYIYIYYLQK